MGRGTKYMKNTGRKAVWVENHCSNSVFLNRGIASFSNACRQILLTVPLMVILKKRIRNYCELCYKPEIISYF